MNYTSVVNALKSVSTDNKDFLFAINSEGSPKEIFYAVEATVSALDDFDTDTDLITSAFETACSDFKLKAADSAAESAAESADDSSHLNLDGLWKAFNEMSIVQQEIVVAQQKGKLLQEQILDSLTSLSGPKKQAASRGSRAKGAPAGAPVRSPVKDVAIALDWSIQDADLLMEIDKPLNLKTDDLTRFFGTTYKDSDSPDSRFNWKFFIDGKPYSLHDKQSPDGEFDPLDNITWWLSGTYKKALAVLRREVKASLLA